MTHRILQHIKKGGEVKAHLIGKDTVAIPSDYNGTVYHAWLKLFPIIEGFQPGDIIRDGDVREMPQIKHPNKGWVDGKNASWAQDYRTILRRVPKVEEKRTLQECLEIAENLDRIEVYPVPSTTTDYHQTGGLTPCPLCGLCRGHFETTYSDKAILTAGGEEQWSPDYKKRLDHGYREVGADGWVKVEDRLPQIATENIVCNNGQVEICLFNMHGKWGYVGVDSDYYDVTHWYPLPKPPTV